MKIDRHVIVINGRASDKLINRLSETFGRSFKNNNLLLFCDYSDYDIPLGYEFRFMYDGENVIFSGIMTLKSVTQQFLYPLDYLPRGWQTICEFEFSDGISDNLKLLIPIIDDWYSTNKVMYLVKSDSNVSD